MPRARRLVACAAVCRAADADRPRFAMTPTEDQEVVTVLARIAELLEQIAAALERIEAQGECQVDLLRSLVKS